MANFCLMPEAVNRFKQGFSDGTIDPYKLNKMTSEERRGVFEKIAGPDAAKEVNANFESKMLLKNQKYAYTAWAKKVAGLTPTTRRDLISKIERLDHVLNPAEESGFLKDLASTKLGVNVSQDEAKRISELSNKITEARSKPLSTTEDSLKKGFSPTQNDLNHGYARYDLQKYISDLKSGDTSFKLSDLKTPLGLARGAVKFPRAVANIFKSIGASLDDSFALRQGYKAFFTNNRQWRQEFIKSFSNLAEGFKNAEEAEREFKAHLMADPHYDQAVKDGLAITKQEDVFPTSLPGKIPIAGRAFNASEVAYGAFAENLRLGIYKQQLKLAHNLGEDMGPEFGKNTAKEVNSLTGRGGLGILEPASGPINIAFYSLRFLKSNIDTLLSHPLGSGVGGTADFLRGKAGAELTSPAQLKAAKNLVKIIAGTAAILETAHALKPNSVDFDPRSSNFGKIKIGDTRFEVTGGMDSIITLAARIATNRTKSSSTGAITKLNSGQYGALTEKDIVSQFLENKASPVGGVLLDKLNGKTPQGTKPTAKSEALKLITPLNINNFQELKNDKNSANILASMLADTFGVSTNTYGNAPSGMSGVSKDIAQALDKANFSVSVPPQTQRNQDLTGSQYKAFTTDANQRFISSVNKAKSDSYYQNLSPSLQNKTLTASLAKARKDALDDVLGKAPRARVVHLKKY